MTDGWILPGMLIGLFSIIAFGNAFCLVRYLTKRVPFSVVPFLRKASAWHVPASSYDFLQCFRSFLSDFKPQRAAKLPDKFRPHAPSGMELTT
jgi:hypothetical protein